MFRSNLSLSTRTRDGPSLLPLHRRCTPRAQLIGMPEGYQSPGSKPNPQEVLLAELRFCDPARLPALVKASLDQLDEDFYKYLEDTINESTDMEERESLRMMRDAITSLMGYMLEEFKQQEAQLDGSNTTSTDDEAATSEKETPLKEGAQATYDELIDTMLNSFQSIPSDTPESERLELMKKFTDMYYHRIDMRFLERLSERIVSAGDSAPLLAELRDFISDAMRDRVTTAMEDLKEVLSGGSPRVMQQTMTRLGKEGRVDDAFVLLLQANVEEANNAGATEVVGILNELLKHATDLRDKEVAPEVRLIRTLLRTDDEQTRFSLLMDSFEGGGSVVLPDNTQTLGTKVDGKKFVAALRKLIEDYGNVDKKFVLKLSKIGEESEAVARKIFDMEGKDVQSLQEEAFHKRSVSIWDLEELEHQEVGEGREAPWEGRLGSIPEKMGFGPDGKMGV